jgi:serine protease Do
MSTKYSRARFGAAVVVAFLCGLIFASGFDLTDFSWAQARGTPTKPAPSQVASAIETQSSFEAVADAARPAVVSIETERFQKARPTQQRVPRTGRGQQLPPGIEDFFRNFDNGRPSDEPEESSGSGFIVSTDGYILTNNHVVADADKVTVTLYDRRKYEAKVVGRDSTTDVAVVKIEEKNLPMLGFGDDAKLRVGQWVLAIGNPLGLNFTVTAGIVSAKGRSQSALLNRTGQNPYAITDYIQTDAAINPGNSGGPLLNIRGDVIGINSAIASGTGYYAGYGFAIPITLAKQVMDDLIKYGKIKRAVLGVVLANEVTPTDAKAAGLSQITGAKVQDFNPEVGSPAAKAGMEVGDIVITAAGQPVDQVSSLQRIIRGFKPGDVVDLEVMRPGSGKKTFKVRLAEPAEIPAAVADLEDAARPNPVRNDAPVAREQQKLGISVSPVTNELAAQYKLSGAARTGIIVTNVSPRGPGYKTMFERDVILSVLYPTKRDIKTADDLAAALAPLKTGDVIELKVCAPRGDGSCQTRAVSVQVP